jgi:hypothetical protein
MGCAMSVARPSSPDGSHSLETSDNRSWESFFPTCRGHLWVKRRRGRPQPRTKGAPKARLPWWGSGGRSPPGGCGVAGGGPRRR